VKSLPRKPTPPTGLVVVLVLVIGSPVVLDYDYENDDEDESGSILCKQRRISSSAG
jgi:hypothetical protein